MKKYYRHRAHPVMFEGTPLEIRRFESDNGHLKEIAYEEYAELKHVQDTEEVLNKRSREYPPLSDLADMLVKWIQADKARFPKDLQDYSDSCMNVKKKYPKPSKK